jgi:hypothetical protein
MYTVFARNLLLSSSGPSTTKILAAGSSETSVRIYGAAPYPKEKSSPTTVVESDTAHKFNATYAWELEILQLRVEVIPIYFGIYDGSHQEASYAVFCVTRNADYEGRLLHYGHFLCIYDVWLCT